MLSFQFNFSILIVFMALFYTWLGRSGPSHTGTMVVLLKLPRSGSTWLTELLNSHKAVFLSKEIIQSGDIPLDGPQEIHKTSLVDVESFLASALQRPMGKFKRRHMVFPGGRFFHDYFQSFKFLRPLKAVGFSLNPEHLRGLSVDWSHVLPTPTSRGEGPGNNIVLVHLERTNVVKMVISKHRGDIIHQSGCENNFYSSSSLGNAATDVDEETRQCVARGALYSPADLIVNWSLAEFALRMNEATQRIAYLRETVGACSLSGMGVGAGDPVTQVHVEKVAYEELQLDAEGVMVRLGAALHLPSLVTGMLSTDGQDQNTSSRGRTQKRTTESLRGRAVSMEVFDTIVQALEPSPSCACVLRQLTSSSPEVFDCALVLISVQSSDNVSHSSSLTCSPLPLAG
jgi:hypothetical protein